MKILKNILTLAVFALLIVACKNEKQPEVKTVDTEVTVKKSELDPNATYAKAEFTIKGMTCEIGCAKTIEKKLAKMEGVKSAKVDFGKELAMVEYDESKVTTDNLAETVSKTADTYTVEDMKTVEAFAGKKACAPDCKKECCAGKEDVKTEKPNKMGCSADCKMECCAEKKGKA